MTTYREPFPEEIAEGALRARAILDGLEQRDQAPAPQPADVDVLEPDWREWSAAALDVEVALVRREAEASRRESRRRRELAAKHRRQEAAAAIVLALIALAVLAAVVYSDGPLGSFLGQ